MEAGRDDDALMAAAGQGDERAFNRLVQHYAPRLHAVARRYTGSDADADEIAQDTLWRAWKAAPDWQAGDAKLSTWLYRVAVNLSIDRLRRRRPDAGADAVDALADEAAGTDTALADRQLLALMRAAIDRLPENQRMAIILSVQQDLSNSEIAETLGSSEGAVEQLLVRARRSLRKSYRSLT